MIGDLPMPEERMEDTFPTDINPRCIFDVLLRGRTNISYMVDEWIINYKTNREDGIRDLMQFFIQSAGCKSQITRE